MKKRLAATLMLAIALVLPASAGDNNIVWLTQTGSLGGNSLTVDQSSASQSTLKGILPDALHPMAELSLSTLDFDPRLALQHGSGNVADLTFGGSGGTLQLLQTSNPLHAFWGGGTSANNFATASLGSGDLGTIVQIGSLNSAELTLGGGGAVGMITQLGANLRANLQVGQGGMGLVTQIGDDNDAGTVIVAPGTLALITQVGSGMRPASDVAFDVMSTHSEAISIKQAAW